MGSSQQNFFRSDTRYGEKITSSPITIGTPLKNDKGIHRSKVESLDMDRDGVHVCKKPRFSQRKGIETESDEDCMIVDLGPENVISMPTFKVENIPSGVVIKGESKVEIENQQEKHTKLNIMFDYEGIKKESIKSSLIYILRCWRRNKVILESCLQLIIRKKI